MRRFVWRRCLLNLLPANFLWPFLLLPWAVILTLASCRRGHSRSALEEIQAAAALHRLRAATVREGPLGIVARPVTTVRREELSWGRVTAVLAVLLCWLPVLGLLSALLAWVVNRRSQGWTLRASQISAVVAALIHAALLGLVIVSALRP
jgi:hypothetical protein